MNKLTKKNTNMENYETLKGLHLKNASCIIDGINCNGILFVEENDIFILQNKKNGRLEPKNEDYKNKGFAHTWCIIKDKKITRLIQSINI